MQENTKPESLGEIIIYKADSGPEIKVSLADDTVWLSQSQMAELFQKDVKTISAHINNLYKEKELEKDKTSFKQANSGKTRIGLDKPITYYNLDVIISVGYRVQSQRGTQFRIWATAKLRDYILKGFVVNEQRLKDRQAGKFQELQGAITLLRDAMETRRLDGYEKELLTIITDYTSTWLLLNKYDHDELKLEGVSKKIAVDLGYERVQNSIVQFKQRLLKSKQATDLFGQEVDYKLKGLLGNVEQTFGGKPLYSSIEEKAAHLLYFAIKDHPFADGNKRIGSLLFLLFLVENHHVYNKKGERIITDNTLTALALLIAESRPEQKVVIVALIVNILKK